MKAKLLYYFVLVLFSVSMQGQNKRDTCIVFKAKIVDEIGMPLQELAKNC
jgi:hypothetical protein